MTRQAPPTNDMARRSAKGVSWLFAGRLAARLLDLCTLMLLARILAPHDFGKVAIALTLVNIVDVISEIPMTQGLVRLPAIDNSHLNTAFTLSLLRAGLLLLLMVAIAQPYAAFNHDPDIVPLICALAFAPVLRVLASPAMVHFMRRMDYKPEFMLDVASKVVAFTSAAAIAYATGSYWAIAAASLFGPAVTAIGSYILAPHRPRLTLAHWPYFKGMIAWHTASQALAAMNWQIDRLLLGHFTNQKNFGLYAVASDVSVVPLQSLIYPFGRTLVSGFSLVASDRERVVAAYSKSLAGIMLVGAPILVGVALLAGPLVKLALGEQWQDAAPLLALFSISHAIVLYTVAMSPLAVAQNRFDLIFNFNLIVLAIRIPAVLAGIIYFGVSGAIAAHLLASAIAALTAMVMIRRMIGISVRDQLRAPWRALLGLAGMIAAVLPVVGRLDAMPSGLPLLAESTALACGGAIVYGAVVYALWLLSGRPHGGEQVIHDAVVRLFASLPFARRQVKSDPDISEV